MYELTRDIIDDNCYVNANPRSGVCIHHSAGTSLNVKSTFISNRTSAHYSVKDDQAVQYLDLDKGAWHAGDTWANWNLVAIENVNSGGSAQGWPVSEETIQTCCELMADIARQIGIERYVVGQNLYAHRDFYATACPGVLYNRLGEIAERANSILEGEDMPTADEVADAVWRYTLPCDDGSNDDCGNFLREIRTNTRESVRTDDPSGRGVEMNDHDHLKWVAKLMSEMAETLEKVAVALDDIESRLEKLEG